MSNRKISELYDALKPGISQIIKRFHQHRTIENKL